MIVIVPYHPAWPEEFKALARPIRAALGLLALRIDHIGSTAVPGLAAKDIIDIQLTVARLEPAIDEALGTLGYHRVDSISQDHIPPGGPDDPLAWTKWYYHPPEGMRPMHLHCRVAGRPNQRYPLLFRDYLRASPAAAEAYARVKIALARYHAGDADGFYAVKDPACDLIIAAAELWAATAGWQPGPADA